MSTGGGGQPGVGNGDSKEGICKGEKETMIQWHLHGSKQIQLESCQVTERRGDRDAYTERGPIYTLKGFSLT